MLSKNQNITLKIDGMTAEGAGVAHHDGLAVFVQNTAVGDEIEAHIIKAKKNYAIGKINKLIRPSKDRIEPDCEVAGRCGGCCFRHINYAAELKIKQQRVEDAFKRIGHLNVDIDEIEASPITDSYRNKAQYPVGRDTRDNSPLIGFYAFNSHRIVPFKECKLQSPVFKDILDIFENWMEENNVSVYDELKETGLLRHLYIRRAYFTGEVMVCVVINGDNIPFCNALLDELKAGIPGFKTLVINKNRAKTNVILGPECKVVFGDGYIHDNLLGCKFRISPLSFYQVNSVQCENLYFKAMEFAGLTGKEVVLDLYCGTGTIGLTMARSAGKLIGVEIVPQAVEDAKLNAKENGITNAEFYCGDAAVIVENFKISPDVIIVDPPRKGLDEKLIHTIDNMAPRRIVYISCDPATLARDCASFNKLGWNIERVSPFDMFPRTAHVETVVLMTQRA